MGDFFMIGPSVYLDEMENWIFWGIFFLILGMTNIIFLNFVIAEAGNSYNKVNEQLEQFIYKNKATLIDEAEIMIPKCFRKSNWYPKYIIIR